METSKYVRSLVLLSCMSACTADVGASPSDAPRVGVKRASVADQTLQTVTVLPSSGFPNSFSVVSSINPDGSVTWSGGQWVINVQASALPLASDLQHILLDITDAVGQPVSIRATSISTSAFAVLGTATTDGGGQRQTVDIATTHTVASGETFTLVLTPGGAAQLANVSLALVPPRALKLSPHSVVAWAGQNVIYTPSATFIGRASQPLPLTDGTRLQSIRLDVSDTLGHVTKVFLAATNRSGQEVLFGHVGFTNGSGQRQTVLLDNLGVVVGDDLTYWVGFDTIDVSQMSVLATSVRFTP